MTPIEEMEDLSQLVQVPFTAGTVNRGSDLVGAGKEKETFHSACRDICLPLVSAALRGKSPTKECIGGQSSPSAAAVVVFVVFVV